MNIKSTPVLVSKVSRWLFYRDDLVPGSTYAARVRSKPHQDSHLSGGYSEWSSAVNWTIPEGDEAQPKNLRCLFNGLDRLNCSWEVRRELPGSVSFALFYKISPESVETQCFPVEEKELPDAPHVLQRCEIRVTNPKRLSQYLITVRPQEEEKMIAPVSNIKVEPPYELSVTKLKNQLYKLQWKCMKTMFPRMYQVLYWEADKVPEKNHLQNISEDVSQFTFQSLEPGTHYKAKMRTKAHTGAYDGPWSEWSKECEWVTESGHSEKKEVGDWNSLSGVLPLLFRPLSFWRRWDSGAAKDTYSERKGNGRKTFRDLLAHFCTQVILRLGSYKR
ncbi:UNVERIFIED_CONTAM: hypothetical protein K2H54_074727 [Gekko kuhli]